MHSGLNSNVKCRGEIDHIQTEDGGKHNPAITTHLFKAEHPIKTNFMDITAIRGFNDILPGDSEVFRLIESEAYRVFSSYGYSEVRLPVVEKTELFSRSIGCSRACTVPTLLTSGSVRRVDKWQKALVSNQTNRLF